MFEQFSRSLPLLGRKGMEKLFSARVLLVGLGGVGGYALEALARAGVGALDLVDGDKISFSNLNRQLLATHETVGQMKADLAKARVQAIFPEAKVRAFPLFYSKETENMFDLASYDYVIDAVDDVAAKVLLIVSAKRAGVPVISAMGAGNKLDPSAFKVKDLSKTSVCPLARIMRRELKKFGVEHLKVVCSDEPPIPSNLSDEEFSSQNGENGSLRMPKRTVGSVSFVPPVAGFLLAGEVIKDLIAK